MDVKDYNARWLKAWSDKDVETLMGIYADDVRYFDQQTAQGVDAAGLRAYLTGLFAATPPMRFEPEEVWETPNGYCGRWYCYVGDAAKPSMRGFDLVVMQGDRIVLNEVYTHNLPA